jgi:isopentenyl diphosphate isomerase/L-lactate dehydrogenase-like FMN-dependent dehydrogenase
VGIADLRSLARRRLPAAVFDYLDGGAEGEVTQRENRRVFEDVTTCLTDNSCNIYARQD